MPKTASMILYFNCSRELEKIDYMIQNMYSLRELDKIVIVDIHEKLIKTEQFDLLNEMIMHVLEMGKNVAINLQEVAYINSGVIHIFISAVKKVHDNAKELYLVAPSESIKAMFYVTNLDRILNIIEEEKDLPV